MTSGNIVVFNPGYYPPDINCTLSDWQDPKLVKLLDCSVTDSMVSFLNLKGSNIDRYFDAYCSNPPKDDGCPHSPCPNPDVAGPLVRIANYVTGFCLAILIFYSPRRVKAAFWSQALVTYSLLITCGISLCKKSLTRAHAIILISILFSPVNVYFLGYSVRAFWSSHQLDAVLGRKQYVRRAMVFFAVSVWIVIIVYVWLPQNHTKFSQYSCPESPLTPLFFLVVPFYYPYALASDAGFGVLGLFVFLLIPILIATAWVVAIIWRRKEIWPPGQPWRPMFGKVWRTIMQNYPFLQFWSVVAFPTAYWVGIIELSISGTQDNNFSLTFGQVLAVFATVPPLIEVSHLAPDLWRWFINLPLVRFITRRPAPEVPSPEEFGVPSAECIDQQNSEKKGTVDGQFSTVIEQPRLRPRARATL